MLLVAGLGWTELLIILFVVFVPLVVVGGGIYWLVRLASRHGARDAARMPNQQLPPGGTR